jgi:hypothetical protein
VEDGGGRTGADGFVGGVGVPGEGGIRNEKEWLGVEGGIGNMRSHVCCWSYFSSSLLCI